MHARPGDYKIIIKNRKGFVKLALQTGASLVPVFSFGELDVYGQPSNEPGTFLRTYQDFFKKLTGVTLAMFYGRGFLENSFGWLPYRKPITTVIGRPIDVVKNAAPSREDVDALHQKFIEEICELFENHKDKYHKEAVKLILE